MAYSRRLVDEKGRWLPDHSLFWEMVDNHIQDGTHCDCCPGPRRHVFLSPILKDQLDVRKRRWTWLSKTRPGLMRREAAIILAWCKRTGRDDADWWWRAMLAKYHPLGK
jgi:hypothetical protein